ncbi:hypothetical protein P4C99_21855 [Pontiellaceae bacterium B1224]|nr:hypothetical protein [Pontiellaceae bacterium B1224]
MNSVTHFLGKGVPLIDGRYREAKDEMVIKITTVIKSNSDDGGGTPPSDGDFREDTYTYILEYGNNGEILSTSAKENWLSCSAYPPSNLATIDDVAWGRGEHCAITKEKVDALYGADE